MLANSFVDDFRKNKNILLHTTCNNGHLELVETLITEHHCNPVARGEYGVTPLHIAARNGRDEIVRQLVSKYDCPVDCVDEDGETPLHYACSNGSEQVVMEVSSL